MKDVKNKLDDVDISQLLSTSADDYWLFNKTLKQIMVPRVSGTPSHSNVRKVSGFLFPITIRCLILKLYAVYRQLSPGP